MTARFKELLARHGRLALMVYFTIFLVTLVGFALAMRLGYRPDSVSGELGLLGAAWVATKLTQPLRILATLFITPVLAKCLHSRENDEPAT